MIAKGAQLDVKETAKAAATKPKAKDVLMMEGKFNKYGKWKREEVKEKFVPCTLTFGCILKAQ